jgi:hypothetical protein
VRYERESQAGRVVDDDEGGGEVDNNVTKEEGVDHITEFAARGAHGEASIVVARLDDGVEDVRVGGWVEHARK